VTPDPPVDVRVVVMRDEPRRELVEIPVSCRYVGLEDNVHVWEVIDPPSRIVGIRVAELPAHTSIATTGLRT